MTKILIAAMLASALYAASAPPAQAGVCIIKRGVYVCIPRPRPPWMPA